MQLNLRTVLALCVLIVLLLFAMPAFAEDSYTVYTPAYEHSTPYTGVIETYSDASMSILIERRVYSAGNMLSQWLRYNTTDDYSTTETEYHYEGTVMVSAVTTNKNYRDGMLQVVNHLNAELIAGNIRITESNSTQYDEDGALVGTSFITNHYDSIGRLSQRVRDENIGELQSHLVEDYTYDADDNIVSQVSTTTYSNGLAPRRSEFTYSYTSIAGKKLNSQIRGDYYIGDEFNGYQVSEYIYDAAGNNIKQVSTMFDKNRKMSSHHIFDRETGIQNMELFDENEMSLGHIEQSRESPISAYTIDTLRYYDADGNLLRYRILNGTLQLPTEEMLYSLEVFDADGVLLSRRTSISNNKDYTLELFDAQGNVTETIINDVRYGANDKRIGTYNIISNDYGETSIMYDNNRHIESIVHLPERSGDIHEYLYVASERQWYLNGKPFNGVPPINPYDNLYRKHIWYPSNTVSSMGVPLRDLENPLTSKWYHVTPIDLTSDGTHTFPLIGGNVYFIGSVTATVKDGALTVTYKYLPGSIEGEEEYYNVFTTLSGMTADDFEQTDMPYAYGEAISISEDLGGADTALLFVRNKATFCDERAEGAWLSRYWKDTPVNLAARACMLAMIEGMEE